MFHRALLEIIVICVSLPQKVCIYHSLLNNILSIKNLDSLLLIITFITVVKSFLFKWLYNTFQISLLIFT